MVVWGGSGLPGTRAAPGWGWTVLSHSIGALFLVLLAARALRRKQLREGQIDSSLTNVGYTLEALPAEPIAPAHEGHGAIGPTGAPRTPAGGRNPIAWRELRQPMFNRRWLRRAVRSAAALVLGSIYALTWAAGGLDEEAPQFAFGLLFNAIVWLLVTVLSATAIAQEKESDTWTLLLATPLSGSKIVLGKLWGLIWRLRWVFAVVAGHFTVFAACSVISWTTAAAVVAVIFAFNFVWMATGLYLSLRVAKVTVAVVINLLLAVALHPVLILAEVAAWETVSHVPRGGPISLLALPYWYIVTVIDLSELRYATGGQTITIPPDGPDLDAGSYAWFTLAACVAHLLVGAAVLWWTTARFDRIVGRARQVHPPPTIGPDSRGQIG
jgi:hypothetical protein